MSALPLPKNASTCFVSPVAAASGDRCLRALIFDVDGTLADTEETHRQAFNFAFLAFDLDWEWSKPLYRELLKTSGGKGLHLFVPLSGKPTWDDVKSFAASPLALPPLYQARPVIR